MYQRLGIPAHNPFWGARPRPLLAQQADVSVTPTTTPVSPEPAVISPFVVPAAVPAYTYPVVEAPVAPEPAYAGPSLMTILIGAAAVVGIAALVSMATAKR